MASILNAADVSNSSNKFIIGALPTEPGDVSIMTMEQLDKALCELTPLRGVTDPSFGYDSSTYYVYGIVGLNGDNSTSVNLQKVDVRRYKQMIKPTTYDQMFYSEGQLLFGGPLFEVFNYDNYNYEFSWFFKSGGVDYATADCFWNGKVPGSVCVAVVRVK